MLSKYSICLESIKEESETEDLRLQKTKTVSKMIEKLLGLDQFEFAVSEGIVTRDALTVIGKINSKNKKEAFKAMIKYVQNSRKSQNKKSSKNIPFR